MKYKTMKDITWHYVLDIHDSDNVWYSLIELQKSYNKGVKL